jgi:superfamily II DNA or RNA helicase
MIQQSFSEESFSDISAQSSSASLTALPNHSPELPGISLREGFQLRAGQVAFLRKLAAALARGEASHLGVFVPGYGKTITALAAFVIARHSLYVRIRRSASSFRRRLLGERDNKIPVCV